MKWDSEVGIPRRRRSETRRFCFSSPKEQHNQIQILLTTAQTRTHTQSDTHKQTDRQTDGKTWYNQYSLKIMQCWYFDLWWWPVIFGMAKKGCGRVVGDGKCINHRKVTVMRPIQHRPSSLSPNQLSLVHYTLVLWNHDFLRAIRHSDIERIDFTDSLLFKRF